MKQPANSDQVAKALVLHLARYARRVTRQQQISAAEKRHLLRLKPVMAIRDGNWELDKQKGE